MLVVAQCVCGTSPTLLYQADAIRQVRITHMLLSNSEGTPNTVSVFQVPQGAVAAMANAIVWQYKLSGNSYVELMVGCCVDVNHSIWVQGSDGVFLNAHLTGEYVQ